MLTGDSVTRIIIRNSCHVTTIWSICYVRFQILAIEVPRHIKARIYVVAPQVLKDVC
jgi:hypothetical protein